MYVYMQNRLKEGRRLGLWLFAPSCKAGDFRFRFGFGFFGFGLVWLGRTGLDWNLTDIGQERRRGRE